MTLAEIKYKYIKLFSKNITPFYLRIFFYIVFSILFYKFMQNYSPLGIEWRPYHYERVKIAIENILENPFLTYFGYTSWDNAKEVSEYIKNPPSNIYLVPVFGYILHAFFQKFIENYQLLDVGSLLDFILISILGVLIAELGLYLISIQNVFESIFYGIFIFAIFITSPWAYKMMLTPWPEAQFLSFYLLSYLSFIKNKKYLGLFFIFLSGLMDWMWLLLFILFFILMSILNISLKKISNKNFTYLYLPKTLQDKKGLFLYLFTCFIPFAFYKLNHQLLRFWGIDNSGSNILFRIGVDSFNNIHHGGIIAALQFLGGNRFSNCFLNENLNYLPNFDKYISYFNCSTSILGMTLFSLISIVGLLILLKNNYKAKWVFSPLTWSFFAFCLIFQQSSAVHLKGYSIIFAFIFSINIVFFFKYIGEKTLLSKPVQIMILIPIFTGIVINSIRVSYLTGING